MSWPWFTDTITLLFAFAEKKNLLVLKTIYVALTVLRELRVSGITQTITQLGEAALLWRGTLSGSSVAQDKNYTHASSFLVSPRKLFQHFHCHM